MDSEFAEKLLDILIDNSLALMRAGFGINWVESSFFDIVRLLSEEHALKDYFLERVRATLSAPDLGRLDPGMVPAELIELVAHEFRWPQIQELAQKRVVDFFHGDSALAVGDMAHRLANAYDDKWSDREFYKRYQEKQG